MHPNKLAQLLADGHITQDEHDTGVAEWNRNQAIAAEEDAVTQFLAEVAKSPIAMKKKLIREKAMDLRAEAALCEDRIDSRRKNRKASQLSYSLRGSGGMSF
tara:strand:+ start:393 stop:698 length:306 start_codon:yes stop_codon:yes gene_type:complete